MNRTQKALAIFLYLGSGVSVALQMLSVMAWLNIWNANPDPRVIAGLAGATLLIVAAAVAIHVCSLSWILAAIGLVGILFYYTAIIAEHIRLHSFYLGPWYDLLPVAFTLLSSVFTVWIRIRQKRDKVGKGKAASP